MTIACWLWSPTRPALRSGYSTPAIREVEIRLFGVPDLRGFIVDYDDIAQAWAPIGEQLDHRCLNDIKWLGSASSTERLVLWVFGQLLATEIGRHLSSIRISEASTTHAEVSRTDYERWMAACLSG